MSKSKTKKVRQRPTFLRFSVTKQGSVKLICGNRKRLKKYKGVFMLRLNKRIEYALMALKHMAKKQEGELTTAREICSEFGTPFDTVAKVMQTLNNKDILRSIKGVKGGYYMNRSLDSITFIELVRIIETPKNRASCDEYQHCELEENCNIKNPIQKLHHMINDHIGSLSLQKLLIEMDDSAQKEEVQQIESSIGVTHEARIG